MLSMIFGILILFLLLYSLWVQHSQEQKQTQEQEVFWELDDNGSQTIKWVDFQVSCEALKRHTGTMWKPMTRIYTLTGLIYWH